MKKENLIALPYVKRGDYSDKAWLIACGYAGHITFFLPKSEVPGENFNQDSKIVAIPTWLIDKILMEQKDKLSNADYTHLENLII